MNSKGGGVCHCREGCKNLWTVLSYSIGTAVFKEQVAPLKLCLASGSPHLGQGFPQLGQRVRTVVVCVPWSSSAMMTFE